MTPLPRFLAAACTALLCAAALAAPPTAPARDAGLKPQAPTQAEAADKGPRCQTQAVNECRAQCDVRKFEVPTVTELARRRVECKTDCVRGC